MSYSSHDDDDDDEDDKPSPQRDSALARDLTRDLFGRLGVTNTDQLSEVPEKVVHERAQAQGTQNGSGSPETSSYKASALAPVPRNEEEVEVTLQSGAKVFLTPKNAETLKRLQAKMEQGKENASRQTLMRQQEEQQKALEEKEKNKKDLTIFGFTLPQLTMAFAVFLVFKIAYDKGVFNNPEQKLELLKNILRWLYSFL